LARNLLNLRQGSRDSASSAAVRELGFPDNRCTTLSRRPLGGADSSVWSDTLGFGSHDRRAPETSVVEVLAAQL